MTDESVGLDMGDGSSFEHVRASDGEVVGYITMTADGLFVPFDLLHRKVAPAGELDDAEELLETIGLGLLADTYVVTRDGRPQRVRISELTRSEVTVMPLSGDIDPSAPAVDLTSRWSYPLPTGELVAEGH